MPPSWYACFVFMQVLELSKETNFRSWIVCIKGQLDDEPCTICITLLFVMGICLALFYGFGTCCNCSESTIQRNCKASIWLILRSVPSLPLPVPDLAYCYILIITNTPPPACGQIFPSNFYHAADCYFRSETGELLVIMHSHRTCFNVEFDEGGNSTLQHVVSRRTKSLPWFI